MLSQLPADVYVLRYNTHAKSYFGVAKNCRPTIFAFPDQRIVYRVQNKIRAINSNFVYIISDAHSSTCYDLRCIIFLTATSTPR